MNDFQEVAVKKFLDQDFSGDSLVQFKSEVSRRYLTYIIYCCLTISQISNLIHVLYITEDKFSWFCLCRLKSC